MSEPQISTIGIHELGEAIKFCYHSGIYYSQDKTPIPVFVWGEPGLGKSGVFEQTSIELGLRYVPIHLSNFDTLTLEGAMDIVTEGSTRVSRLVPLDIFPKDHAFLSLEELPNALEGVQTIGTRILQSRNLENGWRATERTLIGATGNLRSHNAGANTIIQTIDNRVNHFLVKPNMPFWRDWAQRTFNRTNEEKDAVGYLSAFFKIDHDWFHKFDPDSIFTDSHGWPSPRSWSDGVIPPLAYAIKTQGKLFHQSYLLRRVVEGAVGTDASRAFFGFLDVMDELPDIDKLLEGGKIDLPKRTDVRYVWVNAIARRSQPKYHNRIWEIVNALTAEGKSNSVEFAVLLVRAAGNYDKSFNESSQLDDFVAKHTHIIGIV